MTDPTKQLDNPTAQRLLKFLPAMMIGHLLMPGGRATFEWRPSPFSKPKVTE